jgi:hypothetical protein
MSSENFKELPIPSEVLDQEWALELVRVWAAGGKQHITVAKNIWEDPANWGILLVDLAKHIAKSHSEVSYDDALARIKEGFDAEWQAPTDDVN